MFSFEKLRTIEEEEIPLDTQEYVTYTLTEIDMQQQELVETSGSEGECTKKCRCCSCSCFLFSLVIAVPLVACSTLFVLTALYMNHTI